jgi:hypothetical protein
VTTGGRTVGLPPLRERFREQTPLWFAFFGGATAWGVRIGASYILVPRVCRWETLAPLHGVAAGTLVLALVAAFVGYRVMADARAHREAEGLRDTWERSEFLGLAALLLSAFFAGVIVLESVANFVIDPCAQVRV